MMSSPGGSPLEVSCSHYTSVLSKLNYCLLGMVVEQVTLPGHQICAAHQGPPLMSLPMRYLISSQVSVWRCCCAGYICFIIIGSAVIPAIYPPAKW